MESPPSSSSWSQPFVLSDDSGLLLTNGSYSSGKTSFESRSEQRCFVFEDSDCEEKSLSQDDSLDGMSDIMCGENFNTLKKGPNWTDLNHTTSPIEPPLEFQDQPKFPSPIVDFFCDRLSHQILKHVMMDFKDGCCFGKSRCISPRFQHPISPPPLPSRTINQKQPPIRPLPELPAGFTRPLSYMTYSTPHQPNIASSASPYVSHTPRPSSRSSLGGSSRLSSSHNSLSMAYSRPVDDSTFITQAVSHDTLSSNQINDLYNVPYDSDVYALPVDVVKPNKGLLAKKKNLHNNNCRSRSGRRGQRHSVAGTSGSVAGEPIHMTLQEVRTYLQSLYSSSSDSSETLEVTCRKKGCPMAGFMLSNHSKSNNNTQRPKKSPFLINIKTKKVKDSCEDPRGLISPVKKEGKRRKIFNFKQALCNIFRFRRILSVEEKMDKSEFKLSPKKICSDDFGNGLSNRALPPLPPKKPLSGDVADEHALDFATSIQRVKDYGWYWGPLSSESAEKILSNEPDGSFIVRDSSDDHYIFSLTFKLNNSVRHVRIEHFQGNFSFGSCTKFKSQTIVEFIENAVEYSRSGRYLFFLHRRPVIGPVRVQLLHPFSRFKQVQSLQHMCRFIIHKNVRRDLIPALPLPRRMIDYLNTPHYYSERFSDLPLDEQDSSSRESSLRGFAPPITEISRPSTVPANEYIVFNTNNSSGRQSLA
ncbi:uncharacterized protein [Euwallacea fornicatus]|uniref:uncharacterized protein n=1 Tax=Euwallacea fornicatus TaxID=995702 RepID=UPI00338F8806